MAVPQYSPWNQASTMAGTFLSIQLIVRGRPLSSTTTVGLPASCTAWTSLDWKPVSSRLVRDLLSPTRSEFSPSTTTAASTWRAMFRALSISACSRSLGGTGADFPVGNSCIDEFTSLRVLHLYARAQFLADAFEHGHDIQIRRAIAALRVLDLGCIGTG